MLCIYLNLFLYYLDDSTINVMPMCPVQTSKNNLDDNTTVSISNIYRNVGNVKYSKPVSISNVFTNIGNVKSAETTNIGINSNNNNTFSQTPNFNSPTVPYSTSSNVYAEMTNVSDLHYTNNQTVNIILKFKIYN